MRQKKAAAGGEEITSGGSPKEETWMSIFKNPYATYFIINPFYTVVKVVCHTLAVTFIQ